MPNLCSSVKCLKGSGYESRQKCLQVFDCICLTVLVMLHLSVSEYICNLSILNRGNLSSL